MLLVAAISTLTAKQWKQIFVVALHAPPSVFDSQTREQIFVVALHASLRVFHSLLLNVPCSYTLLFPVLAISAPPTVKSVVLNLRAATFLSNSSSSSPKVLPFGSGSRHQLHKIPITLVPAQKKPALAPHPHAVGLSMRGVMMFVTMPEML